MSRISAAIIQPTIIAIGASIFLYSYNNKLRVVDYFLHVPFWIGVVRPSGLYWHSTVLKQVNKGVFPPEMKVYREMYLATKNAILYDVVLNHTLYHFFMTPLLISYMYVVNNIITGTQLDNRKETIAEGKQGHKSLGSIMKNSFWTLLQGRALISCVSILLQYWISYVSLARQGSKQTYSLPNNVKRFLLAKQMLLSWSWSGLILREFYQNYWIEQSSLSKVQSQSI